MADSALLSEVAHLPSFIGLPVAQLSQSIGFPIDQILFLICIISGIPFGFLHQSLPNPFAKHVYSIVLGLTYIYVIVGTAVIHSFLTALAVYLIVNFVPRKIAPGLVWISSMAYLSGGHIYRMYTDYLGWHLDWTTPQMILTVKVVTFAYNYADGLALKKGERLHEKDAIHEFRKARALEKLPSLLEYFSYIYFFGGVLAGPAFEMREYLDFTDLSLFKKANLNSIPNPIVPTLKALWTGLYLYVGIFLSSKFPVNGYVDTDAFLNHPSALYRMSYFVFAVAFVRYKYYLGWYIAEAGCIAAGFGFNGFEKDGKTIKWDRVSNADWTWVEFGTNMPEITNHWNKGVNNWLKNYIYMRVEPPKFLKGVMPAKLFANVCTKFTSAFWHGFYPAYYLFFLCAAIVNMCDDEARRIFRPMVYDETGKPKVSRVGLIVYDVLGFFGVMIPLNYLGGAFVLLTAEATLKVWKSVFFFGNIAPIVFLIVAKVMFPVKKVKSDKTAPATPAAAASAAPAATPSSESSKNKTN